MTTLSMDHFQKLMPDSVFRALGTIIRHLQSAGGYVFLVGGCVRNAVMNRPIGDIDMEVFGMSLAEIVQVLSEHFQVEETGKSYGVVKVHGLPVDIAVPRSEKKNGRGHRDFQVKRLEDASVEEAAKRRDFTINALYFDVERQQLEDPFNGLQDIQFHTLRHVSAAFVEDPLRVLRGMQFAGRFLLSPAPETAALCAQLSLYGLSKERILGEMEKWLLLSEKPSYGLRFLSQVGWLRFFPEIERLKSCMQDPRQHPEGSVFEHTCLALDVYAEQRTEDRLEDLIVGFAVLCHDFGKPYVTTRDERGVHHFHHDQAGEAPARRFLMKLGVPQGWIEAIIPLILSHMRPRNLFKCPQDDVKLLRLAHDVGRIDRLSRVTYCDFVGRKGWKEGYHGEIEQWLSHSAKRLDVWDKKPVPLIQGRDLVALGMEPSEKFSHVLKICYQAQLDGKVLNKQEGLAMAKAAYQYEKR